MTLKNSLINTENLTRILLCRIALPLRSVICILTFSICILWGLNNSFAQTLKLKVQSGIYNSDSFVDNLKPGQAILLYTRTPYQITPSTIITYQQIVSSRSNFDFSKYISYNTIGRVYNDADTSYYAAVIDDEFYYCNAGPNLDFFNFTVDALQNQFVTLGLDTIEKRNKYIKSLDFNTGVITVSPVDFRSYLQDWIIVGLVIAILIPAWYLMRRFLSG